nr:tetratricopeptide repeat protein [Actinomycetota bacterium]
MEPVNPASYSVHASLRELSGDLDRARELCREALRLEPDEPSSIHRLVQLAPTLEERRAALDFIGGELDRSPLHNGEGALAYQERAEGVSDNEPLLARLRGWMQTKPGSWAACTALARQLVEARKYDESLAVSKVLVERFPLLPGSWLLLAYAHRVLQDVPGEEQALRRALELNPEWGTTSWLLARLLKRQGDFGGAEQVLERASRYAADDGAVHSELAELLWFRGRRDEALERVERALRADPSQRQAWSRLDTWATEHGDTTRSERLARQVIADLPASPHGWFALAYVLPDSRIAERMAALEEAITRAPRSSDLLDTRAVWLAESRRFEEALAACRPAVFGDRPPRELLARAAWIRWQRGEQEEALTAITALTQADPTFAWAASLRAEWTHSLGRTEEALAAAARLVELEPLQARSHAYLADARRLGNDRVGAVEAFTEAVRIAPGYLFAVQSLLDLYLELERWDEARALLQRSEGHVDAAILRARRAQLSCTVGDWTAAKDSLVQLLVDSPNETSLHATAIEALARASRTDLLREALEEAMAARPSATLGQHWGLFLAKHAWTPRAWRKLDRLRGLEGLGPAAVAAYLEHLAERGAGWTVRLYLRFRLGDLLRFAV